MSDEPERSLEQLVGDLERLEGVVADWEDGPRNTVEAIRRTLEAIQAEAFRRLIRRVKEDPGGLEALKDAVGDAWVRNVLTYHGLLRQPAPSIEQQVEAALESVRPMLAEHSGNVELVAVEGSEVKVQLIGTCDGCAFSDATLQHGIEKAIKDAVPTIERVTAVASAGPKLVQVKTKPTSSPFTRPWIDVAAQAEVRTRRVMAVDLDQLSVLLATTAAGEIKAFPNACTHLGMPLDGGDVEGDVLTCRYHGFQYQLSTGECLTAPDVALRRIPVRVEGERVLLQVET